MPRSQIERLWMIGGALVGFIMVLIGYFFFISPQRSQTSTVDGQVSSVQAANDVLQSKLNRLKTQNEQLAHYEELAAQAKLALPDTNGLSAFLRTLQQIAGATRTDVTSLGTNNPIDVSSIVNGAPATTTSTTGSNSDLSSSPSASPATPKVAASSVHIYALPVTLAVSGSVDALNQFLTQLQLVQPRAVLITQLVETTANTNVVGGTQAATQFGNGQTGINLTMYAFVSPSSATENAQLQTAAGK